MRSPRFSHSGRTEVPRTNQIQSTDVRSASINTLCGRRKLRWLIPSNSGLSNPTSVTAFFYNRLRLTPGRFGGNASASRRVR